MTTIRHHEPQSNLERYAFLFMRLSGIALLLLAVGHMVLQHVLRDVHSLTLQVVQDIWRSWGWRVYDLLLLAFAITHGFNGLRQVIRDYVQQPGRVLWLERALVAITIVTIIWSAVAIMSFNPDAVMAQAGP
jgi:succinate dehydrogenase / fumarate reductase, membrane anchor subunit